MRISIPEDELKWRFIRSAGPGGQNVNKVSSAVQLHFNIAGSKVLQHEVKIRLTKLVGNRINKQGELVIAAGNFRSQTANRRTALQRLNKFIVRAKLTPKKRYPSKVKSAVLLKNKKLKQQQSEKKQWRKPLRNSST